MPIFCRFSRNLRATHVFSQNPTGGTWSHAAHASHYRIPDLYLNKVREDMVHLEDVFERGEKRTHKSGWGGTLENGNMRILCTKSGGCACEEVFIMLSRLLEFMTC
jgi:hypothetical protein